MASNVNFAIDDRNVPSNYTLSLKNVSTGTTKTINTTSNTNFGSTNSIHNYEAIVPAGFYPTSVKMGISPSLLTQDMPMTWDESTRKLTFKAPNSGLISNGGNSYGFILLVKEPDNTKVRLNISRGAGVTSNYNTTPEFPKGVSHFKFEVVEGKRFVDNRIAITAGTTTYKYGDVPNARVIEFDYDVQVVTTMIASSEDAPLNTVKFTESIDSMITSNTGGSSDTFPKGVTEFTLNLGTQAYMFETDGQANKVKLTQGSSSFYSTVKPYQNTLSFSADIQEDFTLTAGAVQKPTGKLTTHLTRCSDNWRNVRENFPFGVWSITFTADENAVFNRNGKLIITDKETGLVIFEDVITPTDPKEFTYTLDNDLGGLVGNVEVFLMADSTIVTASSFLHVYNVTDEEMTRVAQERFITQFVDGNLTTLVDKGKNIVKLMNIPFEIPEELTEPSTIKLGIYNTGIPSTTLKDYRVPFNLGVIEVPHKFNNVLDYVNTELELYLPYTEPIILEPNYVIGKEITVEYVMNMYTGDVDINIYSSMIPDIPFHTQSTNISMNIPFLPTEIYGVEQRAELRELVNNNIKQAQIHVKRNVPVINEFGVPVNKTDLISTFTGYSEITNVKLNTRADSQEQYEIRQLLNNGVILP